MTSQPKNHAEQVQAVWFDPTVYDAVRHGPPYLPETRAKVAGEVNVGQMLASYADQYGPLGWLAALLGAMRSVALVHQTHHWQTSGQSFYGDHLLFERLYNDSLPFIDQVAERAVGLGTIDLVDPVKQASQIARCVDMCCAGYVGSLPSLSLLLEEHLVEAIRLARASLEANGLLTDGTDNLLQGLADKHEEFVYLLKQRATADYSYAR